MRTVVWTSIRPAIKKAYDDCYAEFQHGSTALEVIRDEERIVEAFYDEGHWMKVEVTR